MSANYEQGQTQYQHNDRRRPHFAKQIDANMLRSPARLLLKENFYRVLFGQT